MEVLIVGRTRMAGSARCIGGIASDGTSIRLLRPDGLQWDASVDFRVGQVWDLTYRAASDRMPPHVEDVVVTGGRRLRDLPDVSRCLREGIRPWHGGVDQLFDGLVRFTGNDNGYICRRVGVPDRSTWFWVPDRDLTLRSDGRHYDYTGSYGIARGLAYVGEEPAPARLPANNLVRVSLARWWSPDDADIEERCYLQLSGWF
ncbi:dual OB domain-containing protein [Lysobacter sp. HA35]